MVVLTSNNAWESAEKLVKQTYRNQEKRLKFIATMDELIQSLRDKDPIAEHASCVRRQFMTVGCNHSTHDMTHDIYVSTLRMLELVASNDGHYKTFFDSYSKLF